MTMFLSIEVPRLRYGKMLAEDNDRKTLVLRKANLQVFSLISFSLSFFQCTYSVPSSPAVIIDCTIVVLKSIHKRDNQSELIEEIIRAEDRISFLHNESEYEILFASGNISLKIKKSPSDSENCHPALRPGWLENVLLPKLIKMANNSEQNKTGFPSTLSLIDKSSYQGWLWIVRYPSRILRDKLHKYKL